MKTSVSFSSLARFSAPTISFAMPVGGVFPAVHHSGSRVIAHTPGRHIVSDNADDPADDSDIRTRSIQPAALFNMILQIAFIIFQIPSDASDNLWT